ncbi:MAG: GAF domain-containing protein, partial [Anaerolineales bacterium]|nr:GAF domain-containing protein [Anaerolineales bacterium]
MNQRRQIFKSETQRYAFIGVVFGLGFPVVATLIQIASEGLPLNLINILAVQSADPLLWIIDSAPFILGYVAMLAGRRQDASLQREIELIQKEGELIEAQNTLEERVVERTKELETQSQRLLVAAEIAKDAASSRNLADILQRSGKLIQERFGFYHTGLFLIDASREFAVLTASPTEAGRQMIENGHKLRVGFTGIVGRVASTGEPRIVLDTTLDATHKFNPLLPDTKSEMALPLRVEREIIGVLDVQ